MLRTPWRGGPVAASSGRFGAASQLRPALTAVAGHVRRRRNQTPEKMALMSRHVMGSCGPAWRASCVDKQLADIDQRCRVGFPERVEALGTCLPP